MVYVVVDAPKDLESDLYIVGEDEGAYEHDEVEEEGLVPEGALDGDGAGILGRLLKPHGVLATDQRLPQHLHPLLMLALTPIIVWEEGGGCDEEDELDVGDDAEECRDG